MASKIERDCPFCEVRLHIELLTTEGVVPLDVIQCENPRCGKRWREVQSILDSGLGRRTVQEVGSDVKLTTKATLASG